MLIGFEFVSLNDASNESLDHLHYVLFISCLFLCFQNTVFYRFLHSPHFPLIQPLPSFFLSSFPFSLFPSFLPSVRLSIFLLSFLLSFFLYFLRFSLSFLLPFLPSFPPSLLTTIQDGKSFSQSSLQFCADLLSSVVFRVRFLLRLAGAFVRQKVAQMAALTRLQRHFCPLDFAKGFFCLKKYE